MTTRHGDNSATKELARLGERAYAASWRRSRIKFSDGMTEKETIAAGDAAWIEAAKAILRGME